MSATADAVEAQIIHVVIVWKGTSLEGQGEPERAFRNEEDAHYYIDHHPTPNLCAIREILLVD